MGTRVACLLEPLRATDREEPDLEERAVEGFLDALVSRARASWPELPLDDHGFARHLGERLAAGDDPPAVVMKALLAGGSEMHAGDLYLAYGCAIGDSHAIACFEEAHAGTLQLVVRRFASNPSRREDLVQLLREHFLVPRADQPPRIGDYRGLGPLEGWLRIAAVRRLVDEQRRARRREPEEPREDPLLEQLSADQSWELSFLKSRYRQAFRRAFAPAVAALTGEQRNLLRYQAVDGLTLDQIASLHAMHRSSVDRRIKAAHRALLRDTRAALCEELTAEPAEVESIMRLIRSQLDVSLSRLLRAT